MRLTSLRSVRGSGSLFGTSTYRGLHTAPVLEGPKIEVLIGPFIQDPAHVFPRSQPLGSLVNKGASGGVAEVRMHARYQEVAVLTDLLLALGAE